MNDRLLNINILDHPTRKTKTVFFYTSEEHANYFKELLREKNISYEFQVDPESGKLYFGIDNRYLKEVKRLNFLVFAKFRKPFIANPYLKYTLLLISASFIILALIGYLRS
ncbi:MAG: hypothetical protein RIC15_11575 [Vicingaceae bacterium]